MSFRKRSLDHFTKCYNEHFSSFPQWDFSDTTKKFCENHSFAALEPKVCKIIILGDLCVGKTSIMNRFSHKMFETEYKSTIGVDFQTEEIEILGVPYNLQIWDTAGQERFQCITRCYYRKAHVIILVFDLSSIRTLANCQHWLNEALEPNSDADLPFIFLVGSKKDLLSEEACKNVEELANLTAEKLSAELWSVSSKTGDNIDQLFCRAATLAFDDHIQLYSKQILNKSRIKIGTELISFKRNTKKSSKNISNKCQGIKCAQSGNLNKSNI